MWKHSLNELGSEIRRSGEEGKALQLAESRMDDDDEDEEDTDTCSCSCCFVCCCSSFCEVGCSLFRFLDVDDGEGDVGGTESEMKEMEAATSAVGFREE